MVLIEEKNAKKARKNYNICIKMLNVQKYFNITSSSYLIYHFKLELEKLFISQRK